jgi:quinol monooxygenase YgiN
LGPRDGHNAAVAPPAYGTHGRIVARPGRGDELAAILLEAAAGLEADPDCLLYLVARGVDDRDSVWVTEVWADRGAHAASLADPRARALIERARPLIAAFENRAEWIPQGGKGLPGAAPHSS